MKSKTECMFVMKEFHQCVSKGHYYLSKQQEQFCFISILSLPFPEEIKNQNLCTLTSCAIHIAVYILQFSFSFIQGRLKIWTEHFRAFFLSWQQTGIWKNGTNIISRALKNTLFFKVTRLWLKNWVCHTHLNFKIQKGMAGTIIELQP